MSQLTLDEVKRHCEAVDFTDDDTLLGDLQTLAEGFVTDYLRRDLDAEMPGAWPVACVGAVKQLVALWYVNREAAGSDGVSAVPFGVREMLAPHRDLS
ncbi:head-tail connector protein [Falsihalocynthiibacter arcticus]|uniref:head-tail connector protein n=1 Tax=Falsihalocynthiibacter arcticus TaxID=1579316 RepID=UPI003002322E